MKNFELRNWIGADSFTVSRCKGTKNSNSDETVNLSIRLGPMWFSEHLTPEQAIDLAAALVDFATEIQDAQTTEGVAA